MAYLKLLRPKQWIKNVLVFVGPALGMKLFEFEHFLTAFYCFAAFCLISSAAYAINDALDHKADALHPEKRHRPIASGKISPIAGWMFSFFLAAAAVMICVMLLPATTLALLIFYFFMVLGYSLALKRRMILDVIIIAVGFVVRAWAGATAVEVPTSPWLIACTFTICMFLGFGKRRCEIASFGTIEEAREHRPTLIRYTPELLSHLISVSAGIAIMTFLLYTMDQSPQHQPPFKKEYLLYTLPLVVYGVFRYAMLIESGKMTGPSEIILGDKPFLANIILWGIIAIGIIYLDRLKPIAEPLFTALGLEIQ
jgi:4-hydroxybenzoate polyprenyltransferase